MRVTPEQLAQSYAAMGGRELMEMARDFGELTEIAQTVLRAEFTRRGLEPPLAIDPPQLASREFVTVGIYDDMGQAVFCRSLPEAAGIKVWLRDENFSRMAWGYSHVAGGMRLQVESQDASAALEALKRPTLEHIPFSEEETFRQPRCPKCGAREIALIGCSEEGGFSVSRMKNADLPPGAEGWICEECGTAWTEDEG